MKLWVDDIRNAPDESWIVARTVGAAIRAIHRFSSEITELSLDHDISHQVTIGTGLERPFPCEETFQPVAHYFGLLWAYYNAQIKLGEDAPLWVPKITLHTSNPVGAGEMQAILKLYDLNCEIKRYGPANRLEQEV